MADGLRVTGFPELRARLSAVATAGPQILGKWQFGTVQKARSTAPSRTGRGRASIHASRLTDTRAEVRGAYWLIFMDRGTKAHDILPKGISGSGRGGKSNTKALRFEWKGETVFARKVHRRRMRRRPFLTKAAQDSLRAGGTDEMIGLWNRPSSAKRWRKVAA
jgi:hypothetical protein